MLSGADVEDSDVEVPVEMIVDVNVVGIYVEGVVSGAAELLWLGDAVWVSGFTEVGCSVAIGVVDAEVSGAEVDGGGVGVAGFGVVAPGGAGAAGGSFEGEADVDVVHAFHVVDSFAYGGDVFGGVFYTRSAGYLRRYRRCPEGKGGK